MGGGIGGNIQSGVILRSGVWTWVSGTNIELLNYLRWHDVQPHKALLALAVADATRDNYILLYRT